MKTKLPTGEIVRILNEALRRRAECSHLQVARFFSTNEGPANWDAEIEARPGERIGPDCKRVMISAKLDIQNRFDVVED